jgi:diguanylate cyclase (GGDEF)-like protein
VTIPETDQYAFRIIDGNFKGKRSTNGLFVNGSKCFSHHIQHGDVIAFGNHIAQAKYYALSNLSEEAFSESCEVGDLSEFLSEQGRSANPVDTLIIQDGNHEIATETALTRLASFPELIPNPIIEMDLDGQVTYLNPAAAMKFSNIRECGQGHPILAQLLELVEIRQETSFIREVKVGREIFEQSIHYLPESDLIRTFITRDITVQKEAEAELIRRDRFLQAIAEAANYLLVEMDFNTAIEKVIATLGEAANVDHVYFFQNHSHPDNPAEIVVSLQFEWNRSTLGARVTHWQNKSYVDTGLERWYKMFSMGQMISGITQDFPIEEQYVLNQFNIQSILLVPLLLEEDFWGYLGLADCHSPRHWSKHEESSLLTMSVSISGARQRHQIEEKIRYQAMHDLLTGLPNRWYLNEILAKAISQSVESQQSLALISLDLDRFKFINDTLGHTIGDKLLQSVANRLVNSLREGDIICRWGGDEFTILLPNFNQIEEVSVVARQILVSLEDSFQLQGHELYVSASLGIALLNEHSYDAETLIKHADTSLFYAKSLGRNNYQFYDESFNTTNVELIHLENSLRRALEREELVVYYQPRVNIHTQKITGMEALLRWRHPEMGLVSPNVFIPLAEEIGLINSIGEWVIRQACRQNKIWQTQIKSKITVAVNLSLKQFRQPNLVEMITQILAQTQLEPQYLELEITETIAIQDIDFTRNVLKTLQQMGVFISMDDFGIKESSLFRLHVLPLHNLKIDKSFVQESTTNSKSAAIIRNIAQLGQDLGLKLIAEGVEKLEELEFLKTVKCDDVQGFLFYPPLCSEQATELILSQIEVCNNK